MKRLVQNKLTKSDGTPIVKTNLSIQLVVASFADAGQREIIATTYVDTDATGLWAVELEVNDDLDPAGTHYTIREGQGVIRPFVVPAGTGDLWLRDCLVADPASPAPVVAGVAAQYVDDADAATLAAAQAYTDAHAGGGASTGSPGLNLVPLLGQSIQVGQATGYDGRNDPPSPRVLTFNATGVYADQIVTAVDPLAHPVDTNGAGPGVMFGNWIVGLLPTARKVLLVPSAYNATGFETGSTNLRWKVSTPDDGRNLFENAMRRVQAALTAAGAGATVDAILWCQGETDALGSTDAAVYRQDLLDLIDAIRNRLGDLQVPFIVGQMLPEFRTSSQRAIDIDAVHQSIGILRAYTAFAPVNGTGLSLGDGLHYNLKGVTLLARSMADAYVIAKANTTAPGTQPATPAAPGQVTGLAATAGPLSVALTWSIPSSGTSPITDYRVEYRTGGGAWTVFADGVSTTNAATVTGLTAGTAYDFRVSALNTVDAGTPSSTVTATPTASATAPSQVTGLTATPGPSSVALAWSLPSSDGGAAIADYTVQYRATGGSAWTTVADGVSTTRAANVPGLTNGTGYDFRVAAVNAAGTGTYSATATGTPSAFLPGASIADDYNRSDGPVGASPVGGVTLDGGSAAAIVGGRLKMTSPSSVATYNPGAADYTAQATVVDATGASVAFRSAPGVGFYQWAADGTVVKFPGVTVGTVGGFSSGSVVKVVCAGNTFTFYVNGVQVGVLSDTSNPSGGVGFGSAAAGGLWDDVSILVAPAPPAQNVLYSAADFGSGTYSPSA